MNITYAPGFLKSLNKAFHWKYAPLRAWKTFLRLPREVKWLWQRMTRGWADCDTWGMDRYVARVIPEMLTYLKKHKHGVPGFCFKECPHKEGGKHCDGCFTKAEKEWEDLLDQMVAGFVAGKEMKDELEFVDLERLKKEALELEKTRVHGMTLFVKHFHDLWD